MALTNNFGNSSAVKQYYENYLGRSPTESEIQWWLGNHNSTAEIQSGISASTEARTRAEGLVRQIYGSIGRTGIGGAVNQIDPGGFEAWVNHFLSGKSTAANLQADFDVAVNDYMTQNPNDQYTTYVKSFKNANMTDGEIWRAAESSGDYSEVAKRINGLSKAEVKSRFGLSDADLAYVYSRPGIVAPQETAADTTTGAANNTATNTAANTSANTSNATTNNTVTTNSMGRTPEEQALFDEQQEFSNGSTTVTEAPKKLIELLTPSSTVGEIAAAYNEFQQNNGGNSAANREAAILLMDTLGIPSSTIEQWLPSVSFTRPGPMTSAEAQENIYKELQRQSKSLGTEKEFQTGAAGTKEGGLGSTDAVMRDMAKKLADAGLTSIEQFGPGRVPVIDRVTAIPETRDGGGLIGWDSGREDYVYEQVPTGRWFYEVTVDVGDNPTTTRQLIDSAEVARLGLSGSQPQTVDVKTGERDGFINKDTGEPLTSLTGYDGRGWSGTSAGDGQTIYNVKFDESTGLPMFYNQQKHGKDDYADFLKVLAIGTAIFAPQIGAALLPAGAPAAAALAVGSAVSGLIGSGGDIKSAIKAGLASYLGGVAGSWASRTANSALVGTIATNMTRAAILGGNMEQALISSLVQAAPAEIIKQFPNFSQLPRAAQEAAVAATVDLMRTGGENLEQIALQGATKGATDYALSNIEGYKDLRPAQQEIVRTRVSNVLGGADLSDELLQGAISFGTEAVQYQINDEKAKKDGWTDYETQQAAKSLYGDKVTPALYADKQETTEAEAKEIARAILGREPTEFEYMQLVGLSENDAAQNSDLKAIQFDESTFESSELIEAYKALYGKEPTDEWLAANTDLLGRSDAQATNMLRDAYTEEQKTIAEGSGTTNNTEAEAIWKATGNTGPIPEDLLFQMLSTSEDAARAMAETYAIRQQDIRETTFDGRGYGSPQNARRAAEAAGYNSYTWEGETFTIPPSAGSNKTEERKLELVTQLLSSKGITIASASNEQFQSALDEVNNIPTGLLGNATLQDIVSGKYTSVNLNGGPYRVEVSGVAKTYEHPEREMAERQLPPDLTVASYDQVWGGDSERDPTAKFITLPDGTGAWVVNKDGGEITKFPEQIIKGRRPPATLDELEVNDPEAWLALASQFDKDAKGTVSDYLVNTANSLMLGAYATGNKEFGDTVKQTLSIATQGVGQQVSTMATFFTDRLGMDHNSAMARAGKALQDWGVANQSVSTKAQEDRIIDAVNKAEGVGGKIKAFVIAAKENPGGFMTMVAKEGVQEILPLWAAKAAYRFGTLAAVSANTAIETIESWGSGTKESYEEAKRMGFSDAEARTMASKVGLQSAVVTAFTNGFGDNPLVKRVIGDVVQDSAMGITKAGAREGFTEYFDGLLQNAAQQFQLTGNVNWDQATTTATIGMGVGAGTTAGIMTGASINSAATVGKDSFGENVSYADFMSGAKQVDMRTVNLSAPVGLDADGEALTLGNLVAMPMTTGIPYESVKATLPAQITNQTIVLGIDASGNQITLADLMSGVTENVGFDAAYKSLLDVTSETRAGTGGTDTTVGAGSNVVTGGTGANTDTTGTTGVTSGATGNNTNTVVSTDTGNGTALVTDTSGNVEVVDNTNGTLVVGDTVVNTGTGVTTGAEVNTGTGTGVTDTGTGTVVSDTGTTTGTNGDTTAGTGTGVVADTGTGTTTGANVATGTDISAQLAGVESRLTNAIAAAEAIGLTRDQAITAAVNSIAAELGVTSANLLTQLGTTEAALRTEFSTGISNLEAQTKAQYDALSAAQKAAADALVAQGQTLADAITAAKTETTGQIADVETRLTDAIAAAEAAGLSRDQAITAAVNSVAAELGTSKEDLLTQLGTTEAALRGEIAGVSADVQAKFDALTAEQQALATQLQQQGVDLNTAIQTVQQQTQGQIGALSADMQAKYDALTADQKALANDMAQQGIDLTAAINLAAQQTQAQITGLGQQVDTRINELMQQGQTYQQATQQAIGEINLQNQQLIDLVGNQGRTATQADIDAMQQMVSGETDINPAYDVTGDRQVTQADIDFLTRVVSGVNTDYTPPPGSFLGPTGLYGQLATNEAQRQADLALAQQQREADLLEAQRQGRIADVRGTLAKTQQGVQSVAQQLPQAFQQAQQTTTPLYGAMEYFDPFGDPFGDPFETQKLKMASSTNPAEKTKIASGGYIDDLLAEDMSVDDLMNLLR